ncbi:Homeodomain-like protein, partial [Ochromonadaceae sp. CCMP2298]
MCVYVPVAGRWTNEEHKLFLLGLQRYQKQWKLIAELVQTRTIVQIRTHAQKYFQKQSR